MVNNLVFRWPKPVLFIVLGAHGNYMLKKPCISSHKKKHVVFSMVFFPLLPCFFQTSSLNSIQNILLKKYHSKSDNLKKQKSRPSDNVSIHNVQRPLWKWALMVSWAKQNQFFIFFNLDLFGFLWFNQMVHLKKQLDSNPGNAEKNQMWNFGFAQLVNHHFSPPIWEKIFWELFPGIFTTNPNVNFGFVICYHGFCLCLHCLFGKDVFFPKHV